jgi:tetratricopeptide (TPR) repeat protein
MRGAARTQMDDVQAAVDDLSAAIKIDGKNAEAFYQRSLAWHAQGNLLQALSDVRRAQAENPQDRRYAQWIEFLEGKR